MNEFCRRLQLFDTASISDALDSLSINGGLQGIVPRTMSKKICGRAFTVKYGDVTEEERKIGRASDFIDEVSEGDVIILGNNRRCDCTVWGNILTTMAIMKKAAGTVIDGACRDIGEINDKMYPLFSKSVYMKSGKGRTKKIDLQVPIIVGDTNIEPGDYVLGDSNGVIIVPHNQIETVLYRAELIRKTEEKIVNAVKQGMRLDQARQKYHYHEPWKNMEEK